VLENAYLQAKFSLKQILRDVGDVAIAADNTCSVPSIVGTISPGSALIIGHAYGAPGGNNEFLADRVERFIRNHAVHLDSVIFSGDVFAVPSAAKWDRLVRLSDEFGIDFHIAPGNHDVGEGDNSRRDVWNTTQYRLPEPNTNFLEIAGFAVLLEDSVVTGWQVDPRVIETPRTMDTDKPRILIRHNIAIEEMSDVANSMAGKRGRLPTLTNLAENLPSGTLVISGDTGAFPRLPRLACSGNDRVTFLATGIGEIDGDVVLIMSDGMLYQSPI
jgi:hypothetical protein